MVPIPLNKGIAWQTLHHASFGLTHFPGLQFGWPSSLETHPVKRSGACSSAVFSCAYHWCFQSKSPSLEKLGKCLIKNVWKQYTLSYAVFQPRKVKRPHNFDKKYLDFSFRNILKFGSEVASITDKSQIKKGESEDLCWEASVNCQWCVLLFKDDTLAT